jgi:hypothetical protein
MPALPSAASRAFRTMSGENAGRKRRVHRERARDPIGSRVRGRWKRGVLVIVGTIRPPKLAVVDKSRAGAGASGAVGGMSLTERRV